LPKRWRSYLVSIFVAALAVLPWGFAPSRGLDDLRNLVFDSFQRLAPRPYDPETPVRVIGIDEASLKAYGQWPWPRDRLAILVDRLNTLGAAVIVFDMIFAEADRAGAKAFVNSVSNPDIRAKAMRILRETPDGDQRFADAMSVGPTVLGLALSDAGESQVPEKAGFTTVGDDPSGFLVAFRGEVGPVPELALPARGLGATNWIPDHDQVVRRVPLVMRAGNRLAPALALEALRVAQSAGSYVIRASNASGETAFGVQSGVNAIRVGAFDIATGPRADVRPRYSRSDPARVISALSIYEGKVKREEIEGRIVFVGARAVGLGDLRATPLDPAIPGVDVHAQLVESLMSGALLYRPDWAMGLERVIAVLAFFMTMALLFLAPAVVAALFGPTLVAGFVAGAFFLFDRYGLLIDPVFPGLVVIGGYLVGAVTLWRVESRARSEVRNAFGKFVAPAVVERLAENPELLVLGGETRELSVLFCDLRSFSRISEGLSASELTAFMNAYLTPMTDAILAFEGTIDKYIGDAILAFWNAPLDIPAHQRKAVAAALAMRAELSTLNEARASRGLPAVAFGVGLHAGPCSVGNMGSIRRFDYSILGDAVNLASRLEGASKALGTDILVSGDIVEAARDAAWLDLGWVAVVGRAGPAHVFALAGDEDFAKSEMYVRWRTSHDEMMQLYYAYEFPAAVKAAEDLSRDYAAPWSRMYEHCARRFSAHSENNAGADSPPVWVLSDK
jgi:adenylate cyclase